MPNLPVACHVCQWDTKSMATTDDWARVAEAARDRRVRQLRLTVKQATTRCGVSDTTWTHLDKGQPVSARTLISASEALGDPDALQRVLDGGEPAWPAVDDGGDPASQIAALRAEVAQLTELVTRLLPPD